jgi:hypothetical protein
MPKVVWLYLTALLYDRPSRDCVAFTEAVVTGPHHRWTRRLPADWSGPTLLHPGLEVGLLQAAAPAGI